MNWKLKKINKFSGFFSNFYIIYVIMSNYKYNALIAYDVYKDGICEYIKMVYVGYLIFFIFLPAFRPIRKLKEQPKIQKNHHKKPGTCF